MRLLKVELINLFNLFNHEIVLNRDERITILTAPNGFGKTITLKAIYKFFNKDFIFFSKLLFGEIKFIFDNGYNVIVKRENSENVSKIKFKLVEKNKVKSEFVYPSDNLMRYIRRRIPLSIIDDFLPDYMHRIDRDKWINELSNEIMNFEEVISQFSEFLPDDILSRLGLDIPPAFSEFINDFKVYLIQEQRLILRKPIAERSFRRGFLIVDAIEKYSNELSNLIKQKIGEYAQITQLLDSSFPKRLFMQNSEDGSIENLKSRLKALQEKRQKLSKYGLLKLEEDDFLSEDDIDKSNIKILSLYISDNEKKLSVFDSLIDRIEIFTKILNEKRFYLKNIEIDKDAGFIFKTSDNKKLKLTELSSGEQHEVVMLFELLFKTEENSLVLIDEPEISLHVVWQKEFLEDLEEIIKLQKIDVLIATHSPQIINDRWDLVVNLEAPPNGQE